MRTFSKLVETLDTMKSSRVRNYVIAGLDSYLLESGKVRLFENSRAHQDSITPHSHRFDFTCLVLDGVVRNRLWRPCDEGRGDLFQASWLTYKGDIGVHEKVEGAQSYWGYFDREFRTGETYSMASTEVHSIQFSRGAKVLFFEQPETVESSIIIEPVVDGRVIPTYKNESYMFLREGL